MLTLNGFDVYQPLVDDQAIDGVIRVDKKNKVRFYDIQIKGGRTWANIRCTVHKLKNKSLLFFYNAKTHELVWLVHKNVLKLFSPTGDKFGDVYLTDIQVAALIKQGYSDLVTLQGKL